MLENAALSLMVLLLMIIMIIITVAPIYSKRSMAMSLKSVGSNKTHNSSLVLSSRFIAAV